MKRSLFYILILSIIAFIPFSSSQKLERKKIKILSQNVNVKIVEAKVKEAKKPVKPKIKPKLKKKKIVKKIEKPKPKKQIVEKIEEKVLKEEVIKEEKIAVKDESLLKEQSARNELQSKTDAYYANVYEVINKNKYYPKKSRKFRQEDSIPVFFIIDKSGFISAFKIVRPSPYKELNKAVKKMFTKIKKFDKPPLGIALPLEMNININFKL